MSTPHTLPEITVALAAARDEAAAYFGALGREELFASLPGEWAPIDDLRHLNRSVVAVARGLRYPRLVLRLRFGRLNRRAWSYDRLAALYRAGLATGARAVDAFVPPARDAADEEEYRARQLERWAGVNAELLDAAGRWSERAADRIVLPHPLLGGLSVREMLFFTHVHNLHHVDVAKRRVAAVRGAVGVA